METNDLRDSFDGMMDEALGRAPEFRIPDSFTEDLVRKFEKHLAWKELLSEFGLKSALLLISLLVVLLVLIFPAKNDPIPWLKWIATNRYMLFSLISTAVFVFAFDQLVVKFMMFRKKSRI
jgi:hypothetical protein